ncbi:MAG: membrane protein insertase YidC [Alphaproteobacteria bacterium]|nr:membrane protein insertase YidC [Alphaproteobacteria bacterium]
MTQEKGMLFFMVTVFVIMGASFWWTDSPKPHEQPAEQTQHVTPTAQPVAVPLASEPVKPKELVLALSPRVSFSNNMIHGSIQQRGLQIDDVDLIKFQESIEQPEKPFPLLKPAKTPLPHYISFGWVSTDPNQVLPTSETFWDLKEQLTKDKEITLHTLLDGVEYTCTVRLDDSYMMHVELTAHNTTSKTLTLGAYSRIVRAKDPALEDTFISYEGPLGYMGGALEEVAYKKLDDETKKYKMNKGEWAGFSTKYWLTSVAPVVDQVPFEVVMHALQEKHYALDTVSPTQTLQAGQSHTMSMRFFCGPKQSHILEHYETHENLKSFEQAIDYGWFYFITRPALILITWLYNLLNNFGVIIILITVLVRILMFPLARKSHHSMMKMKKIQPKMKRLQEIYGNDRARLQQEVMLLYRGANINPLHGFLSMILQIPIFFALYKVLFISLEMRHAPFMGWIKDLSQPDHTSVLNLFGLIPFTLPSFMQIGFLPILMGLTMYLQQKVTQQPSMDANQQKMMKFLPILFVFMLSNFPAGLVLYWIVSNILAVVQQWLMKRGDHA